MKDWSTACCDWETRILERRSLIPVDVLFPESADGALAVFNELRVADVVGSPRMGEICRPWITDFVRTIFGAYDPDTGRQHISEFLLSVSKKKFEVDDCRGDHADGVDSELARVSRISRVGAHDRDCEQLVSARSRHG